MFRKIKKRKNLDLVALAVHTVHTATISETAHFVSIGSSPLFHFSVLSRLQLLLLKRDNFLSLLLVVEYYVCFVILRKLRYVIFCILYTSFSFLSVHWL